MEIRIFPDSGHHVHFLPLGTTDSRKEQVPSHFPELRIADIERRLESDCISRISARSRSGMMTWRSVPQKQWVRYRLGTQKRSAGGLGEVEFFGVWIAVESNLGTSQRGYVLEERSASPEEQGRFQNNPGGNGAVSQYAGSDITHVPEREIIDVMAILRDAGVFSAPAPPVAVPGEAAYEELLTHFCFWQSANAEPIDVDLVIDFGNTRTVVLAIENDMTAGGRLRSICRPIHFASRAWHLTPEELNKHVIVDSWIVLHEPLFASARGSPLNTEVVTNRVQETVGHFGDVEQWSMSD